MVSRETRLRERHPGKLGRLRSHRWRSIRLVFSFSAKVVFKFRQNFQSNSKFCHEHRTVSSFFNFFFVLEIQNKKISNMSRVNAKTNGPIASKFRENVAPTLGQNNACLEF